MKRVLCFLITLGIFTTLFSGCKQAENKTVVDPSANEKTAAPEETLEILYSAGFITSGGGTIYIEEDSPVVQEFNKKLNIKLKVQKTNSDDEKQIGLMYASGVIPDFALIPATVFQKYHEQGVFREIPADILKNSAPEWSKRIQQYFPEFYQKNGVPANVDGKFYGVPMGAPALPNMSIVRSDWLKKVGAKAPTTLKEFEEVAKLFTENDPDGDGKKNTYMFAYGQPYNYIMQYLQWSFGITGPWLEDKKGGITYSVISDQYKEFCKYVAGLYKKGYIHPDVTQVKAEPIKAYFTNGNTGFTADTYTRLMPKYRQNDWLALTLNKNPNAAYEYVAPLKTSDGSKPKVENYNVIWKFGTFGKNTSDAKVKRILELNDLILKDNYYYNLAWYGKEGENFKLDDEGMAVMLDAYTSAEAQAKLGIKFLINNTRDDKQMELSYGKEFTVQNKLVKDGYNLIPPVLSPYVTIKSNTEKGPDTKKVESEFFVKALTGSFDIDKEWDAYVKRWLSAGGEDIVKEANEIYKSKK